MDRQTRMNTEMAQPKYLHITASDALEVSEQRVTVDSTADDIIVTLPSVSEAIGRIYTIIATTYVNTITIADKDDSYSWTDIASDFAAAGDGVAYYSDGFSWWKIATIT